MSVTLQMRRNWLLTGLVVFVILVLACAWLDGGREPLREIAEPVHVPEMAG